VGRPNLNKLKNCRNELRLAAAEERLRRSSERVRANPIATEVTMRLMALCRRDFRATDTRRTVGVADTRQRVIGRQVGDGLERVCKHILSLSVSRGMRRSDREVDYQYCGAARHI
jgi:hypothetical protein